MGYLNDIYEKRTRNFQIGQKVHIEEIGAGVKICFNGRISNIVPDVPEEFYKYLIEFEDHDARIRFREIFFKKQTIINGWESN
jgi:hypothetical protein